MINLITAVKFTFTNRRHHCRSVSTPQFQKLIVASVEQLYVELVLGTKKLYLDKANKEFVTFALEEEHLILWEVEVVVLWNVEVP